MPSLTEQRLQQDLAALANPDVKTAFTSREDVFRRLAPYHLLHTSEDSRQTTDSPSEGKIRKTAASAQAALNVFQNRLKKEGDVEKMRLTAEKAYLESLAIRQEQLARQTTMQMSTGNAALQFRPTTSTSSGQGAYQGAAHSSQQGGITGASQTASRPAASSLSALQLPNSWVPETNPSKPSQSQTANLQTVSKIERPLT